MLIDCDSCAMRDIACDDCVITALRGTTPGPVELDGDERIAFVRLAEAGLVPPLRLARRGVPPPDVREIA